MRRLRFYLDASFWMRLSDPPEDVRRRLSYHFLNRSCLRLELLTSPLVAKELRDDPDPEALRTVERQFGRQNPDLIPHKAQAEAIGRELRDRGGFGERRLADLIHVGYAVLGRADALVTWDVKTLAREHVRTVVKRWGKELQRPVPRIGTPLEVAAWFGLRI